MLLHTCNFNNSTLKYGWLNESIVSVASLTIKETSLSNLDAKAFSGYPFENLKYLEIENSCIKIIPSDTFQNLHLESFVLRCANYSQNVAIEAKAFESVRSSLVSLQIQSCLSSFEAVQNITGKLADAPSGFARLYLHAKIMCYIPVHSLCGIMQISVLYVFIYLFCLLKISRINNCIGYKTERFKLCSFLFRGSNLGFGTV